MAMARHLYHLGLHLLRRDDLSRFALSMPMDLQVAGDYFAVSPLGFWQRNWFEMLVTRTGDELVNQASHFYPWWEARPDGEFYRRCGLVKCWLDLRWRPPRNQEEHDDIDLTLECFERARACRASGPLPEETIAALKRLVAESNQNEARIPPRGIGFRRGDVVWIATGKWTIEAPGYFYDDWEDDQATLVLWYGSRTIWVSSLAYQGKDGNPISPTEGAGRGQSEPQDVPVVESVDKWLHRRHYFVENHDDEESSWTLFGKVATYNSICVVSIRFSDESDRAWAEAVFNSVSCPEPTDVAKTP
jgi:hypothetical protein